MRWKKTRWVLAAGCAALGWKLMTSALGMEGFSLDALAAAPRLIFSMAAFLSAVFLTTPETAFRIAEWFSRPFVAILFPSDEYSRPPLSYKLARRYRDEHRWEDAVRQYRKIIRYHPKERDAYLELIEVAHSMKNDALRREYAALLRKLFKRLPRADAEAVPHDGRQVH
jgi:hypothetical protein